MIHPALPLTLLALAAPAAMASDAAALEPPMQRPQVTFLHQRVVIRVPRMTRIAPAPTWQEHKGPKCIAPQALAGALISAPAVVDLLLIDGQRMRAKLDRDCRSADFYAGLYLKPGRDGRVCADRDAFRVRSGARCEINSFKRLSLKR